MYSSYNPCCPLDSFLFSDVGNFVLLCSCCKGIACLCFSSSYFEKVAPASDLSVIGGAVEQFRMTGDSTILLVVAFRRLVHDFIVCGSLGDCDCA